MDRKRKYEHISSDIVKTNPTCISDLPNDILFLILDYCEHTLGRYTCRRWNNLFAYLYGIKKNISHTFITAYSSVSCLLWYLEHKLNIFVTREILTDTDDEYEEKVSSRMWEICKYATLEVMEYIYTNKIGGTYIITDVVVEACIETNNIEKVKWAYSKTNFRFTSETTYLYQLPCEEPIRNNNIELLEYLRVEGLVATENMIISAIDCNSLVVLQWIYTHFGKNVFINTKMEDLVSIVIDNDNMDILKFFVETIGIKTPAKIMVAVVGAIYDPTEAAAIKGLSWLRYLLENGFSCSKNVQRIAVYYGDLEMLRYLKQKDIPLDIELLKRNEPYLQSRDEEAEETIERHEKEREGTRKTLEEINEWLDQQ